MPRNVEIKAYALNLAEVRAKAEQLSDTKTFQVLKQSDVFFNVESGRLKLRRFLDKTDDGREDELIFYQRSDQEGPKMSNYNKCNSNDSEGLKQTLAAALGIKGEVNKTRYLYMVGQTRVHCDEVEGLGEFMELEVVLRDDQTLEEGEKIAHDLMDKLGVSSDNLISGAYMDLILAKKQQNK